MNKERKSFMADGEMVNGRICDVEDNRPRIERLNQLSDYTATEGAHALPVLDGWA